MRKKILIGTMLVLTLLLLMPSIPAVQQNTIDVRLDTRENELLTKFQDLDIEKIKDLLNEKSLGYTPLFLTLFISAIYMSRASRALIFFLFSMKWDFIHDPEIIHPRLHQRGVWLLESAFAWRDFWQSFYEKRGWNWVLPFSSFTINTSKE